MKTLQNTETFSYLENVDSIHIARYCERIAHGWLLRHVRGDNRPTQQVFDEGMYGFPCQLRGRGRCSALYLDHVSNKTRMS